MKKVLVCVFCLIICFSLTACSLTSSRMKSNLEESGYSIVEMTEEQMTELNNELKYTFKGNGSIIYGFYAVNEETKGSITVIEFENKDDLTLMYKAAKESIKKETEAVDLSGYILLFGEKEGVKTA